MSGVAGITRAGGTGSGHAVSGGRHRAWRRPHRAWFVAALTVLVAVWCALASQAIHPHVLPEVLFIGAGSLLLYGLCGDALSVLLVPAAWRPIRPLLAIAFGTAASGMVLMALGVARVPLPVSLWLTLALGLGASLSVRRSASRRHADPELAAGVHGASMRGLRWPWVAVLTVIFFVALIPAWRTGALTIYGQNPDSSQVVGIAVLFQHVPPTATDVKLPLDTVPPQWRFRYPIFYPLAAVSSLLHVDPIRAFPVLSALLVVVAALGFGLLAVRCFGGPSWAGPAVSALIGFTWILQYLAWHPYWNQLWGTALMPFTILFGWQALQSRDGRSAVACGLLLLMLWFAYPLALPYPLVLLFGVLIAFWRRPRRPRVSSVRGWVAAVGLLLLLTPAVVGSVIKLQEAISQLLTPSSQLWGGDITRFIPWGQFAGVGGNAGSGAVASACLIILAGLALSRLPRRPALGFGIMVLLLLLLDLRFRLTASGTYMDFKHLCFVGLIVLTLAFTALLTQISMPGRRRGLAVLGILLWVFAAETNDQANALSQNEQVTPQLLQIRQWAAALPPGASVRVDIPPAEGGMQLWAVYMLGSHPVDSYEPVKRSTYAHAAPGFRADYSLSFSVDPTDPSRPFPQPRYTLNPPVAINSAYVLRRIDWPRRFDSVAQTASQRLVEP